MLAGSNMPRNALRTPRTSEPCFLSTPTQRVGVTIWLGTPFGIGTVMASAQPAPHRKKIAGTPSVQVS